MARDQTEDTRKRAASNNQKIIHLIDVPDPANSDTFRATEWTAPVEFPSGSGNTYQPWPLSVESVPIDQSSEVERTRIAFSNVSLQMRTILRENDGLQDENVRVRKVNPDFLGGENDVFFDVTYQVENASWQGQDATLDLRSPFDRADQPLTNTITRERFPGIPNSRALIR